jgi:hypothetical protein
MQFCVTRVILRDLAALVPQIFHSLHKITHFLTGYINSYSAFSRKFFTFPNSNEYYNVKAFQTPVENFFFYLKIKTRVQIIKNNIKNWFYKGIGALVP